MTDLINEYVGETTWRMKSNANAGKSLSGLQSHISGTVMAKDGIKRLGVIGKKHIDGDYYLHDLSGGIYAPYCVSGETSIQTIDGSKRANLVDVGDVLIGYNEEKKRFEHTTVNKVMNREVDELYELCVERDDNQNIKLKITGNHRVLTNEGWKTVEDLIIDDEILYLTQNRRKKAKQNKDKQTLEELHEISINAGLKGWENSNLKQEHSEFTKKQWEDEEYRNKNLNTRFENGMYQSISENMKINNPMKKQDVVDKQKKSLKEWRINNPDYQNGVNNPNWQDGKSFEQYPKEFKLIKPMVRKRDNFTCQNCGIKESDYKELLSVHHIDHDKQNNNLYNLISLCRNCHGIENYKVQNGAKVISKTLIKAKYTKGRQYKHTVYNFECYPHENYLANSLIVHNCSGNDLLGLLQKGLINVGNVAAKPPKHFSTAIDQMTNFTFLMTGEFQGAQAWINPDILLAPYIHKDKLTYDDVKQELQQFIWNLSFSLRPGFQSVFSNLTFGLRPSKYYENLPVNIGGELLGNTTYSDYQDEIDLFNQAFIDTMIEGPGEGKMFTFPLPTYNITKDFDWNSEISNSIFELAAKWGSPYFSNYLGTDLSEDDNLSMCCRLRLNMKEVQKVSGGIWNIGSNTGSLAVFTINLPRIGYISNGNEKKFYRILDQMLNHGKKYLLKKKEFIREGVNKGLFPMISEYIGNKLFKTYFLTIGINGMNECSMNFCEQDIIENVKWCNEVSKYIKNKVYQFQVESGHLFNYEATPGEGASYSLAKTDVEKYPDIFTQGSRDSVYYTGSTLIPMNYDIDLVKALDHQNLLQSNYTGGTVFHVDIGELGNRDSIKEIVKKTCENTQLPYITWSPSYSICPDHGRTAGKGCCDKSETYTRVVGYLRPVQKFNKGKKLEFDEKIFMNLKA